MKRGPADWTLGEIADAAGVHLVDVLRIEILADCVQVCLPETPRIALALGRPSRSGNGYLVTVRSVADREVNSGRDVESPRDTLADVLDVEDVGVARAPDQQRVGLPILEDVFVPAVPDVPVHRSSLPSGGFVSSDDRAAGAGAEAATAAAPVTPAAGRAS